jgi:hypothetical protein
MRFDTVKLVIVCLTIAFVSTQVKSCAPFRGSPRAEAIEDFLR